MHRSKMIEKLDETSEVWDIIVIGGGATGLGAALESVSRGYRTLLLEQADFSLPPIKGKSAYNHLSVRSAVSVILDRLLSLE